MNYSQNCQTNYRNEYEQEIYPKDLLFYILYRWRSLLLAALLVCMLALGYAVQYNGTILPGKKSEMQIQMEEQTSLLEKTQAQEAPSEQVKTQIKELQTQITELQEELDELKRISPFKYGVLGYAGGVFALALLYSLLYVLSDKIRSERELRDRYGYYLLGTFPRKERKFLPAIDWMLERLEGVTEQITLEEVYWIISINIINLAKEGGTILVTGTIETEKLQEFVDVVAAQIENVTLVPGSNMNATASTLEALAECDAVILVEERGKSLRGKIHKEYESITALAKPVVGYVVL